MWLRGLKQDILVARGCRLGSAPVKVRGLSDHGKGHPWGNSLVISGTYFTFNFDDHDLMLANDYYSVTSCNPASAGPQILSPQYARNEAGTDILNHMAFLADMTS